VPDLYAIITQIDQDIQERLAEVLELRAADPRHLEMLESYLARVDFPPGARVLDLGCGTGAVARLLAGRPGIAEVLGVDPSPVFVRKARELAAGAANLSFREGDARSLGLPDAGFDVAVAHTCLCHVPDAEAALAELFRVLRPGGWLALFDGDYATTTVATGEFDPLQSCADAAMATLVHDRWLARRLPVLVAAAGFEVDRFDGYAYLQAAEPEYLLTLVDRGADALLASGRVGDVLCQALKGEARRRAEAGLFYGSITFASLIARKPGHPGG
jgi:ubiquinone/menaquinone biosynthesis C-methylase UbiE